MGPLVIVGLGTMGLSLARHAAERGLEVRMVGRDLAHAEIGRQKVMASWKRALDGGRQNAEAVRMQSGRLSASDGLEKALQGAYAQVEALPEDLALKTAFWGTVGASWPGTVTPLTASSSLPASQILQEVNLGLGLQNFHLFVPVHRHPLVELASPPDTPGTFITGAHELAAHLGLRVVPVQESSGLAATRMGLAQGLEAMRLLESGHCTTEGLDALLTLGYGHPCGPLELSDRIGLDLRLAIAEHLYRSTGDSRFAPPEILKEKVANGELGRKSGRGFYAWTPDGTKA